MNRRSMLKTSAVALGTLAIHLPAADAIPRRKRLGVSTSSYGIRWRAGTADLPAFGDALGMIEHCQKLGAGGVQIGVGRWTPEFARQVRERIERYEMFLEGQIGLPRDEADVERFDREVAQAKEAGVGIIRCVMLGGRRYETFKTMAAWEDHKARAWKSVSLTRPVMARHRVKLAIENHKDWRAEEMVDVIRRLDSEWIGVNLDLGNNVSLLDQPMQVIETLAPYTLTTHFKDMAVAEYEDGFLLSEVPLGQGLFDLEAMMAVLEKANPAVQYNLETITRDPLKVPVYTEQYWTTFPRLPAVQLAETLRMVSRNPPRQPLPRVTGLSRDEHIALEERNNADCFTYARSRLGL